MTQSSVPMNLNLASVIDEVGRTKGIDRKVLLDTLEAAILTAARRTYGAQREIEAQFNEENGEIELFQIITVSDDVDNPYREVDVDEVREAGFEADPGDELLFQIFYRDIEFRPITGIPAQYTGS